MSDHAFQSCDPLHSLNIVVLTGHGHGISKKKERLEIGYFHSNEFYSSDELLFQIVPFSQSEIDLMVSTFRLLTDEVRRNIPDILLASMTILVNLDFNE